MNQTTASIVSCLLKTIRSPWRDHLVTVLLALIFHFTSSFVHKIVSVGCPWPTWVLSLLGQWFLAWKFLTSPCACSLSGTHLCPESSYPKLCINYTSCLYLDQSGKQEEMAKTKNKKKKKARLTTLWEEKSPKTQFDYTLPRYL